MREKVTKRLQKVTKGLQSVYIIDVTMLVLCGIMLVMKEVIHMFNLPSQLAENYHCADLHPFTDKRKVSHMHMDYMLNLTSSMFEYSGLPETITARMLELYLQVNGFVCIYNVKPEDITSGKTFTPGLYAFYGGLGGELDPYYRPTLCVIANPALGLNVNARIGKDCVVILNVTLGRGFTDINRYYGTSLAENELSMKMLTVTMRSMSVISATDDRAKASADAYLKKLENGELGAIMDSSLTESLHVQPYATTSSGQSLTALIEQEQYLKGSWFNRVGLNALFNMKRETINASEAGLNDDALLPIVDDMLKMRQDGLTRVNEMFGTNITVKKASSWENIEKQAEISVQPENTEKTEVEENANSDNDASI